MKIPGAARLVSGLLATAMGVASQMPAAASSEASTATSPEAARSASTGAVIVYLDTDEQRQGPGIAEAS